MLEIWRPLWATTNRSEKIQHILYFVLTSREYVCELSITLRCFLFSVFPLHWIFFDECALYTCVRCCECASSRMDETESSVRVLQLRIKWNIIAKLKRERAHNKTLMVTPKSLECNYDDCSIFTKANSHCSWSTSLLCLDGEKKLTKKKLWK